MPVSVTANTQDPGDQTQISLKMLPWQAKLFTLLLILPSEFSFNIGSFHLKGYRVFLLLMFIPCFIYVFGTKKIKSLPSDWFLLAYGFWIILALCIHQGTGSGLESGGITMVESLSAYLIARTCIRTPASFAAFVKLLIIIVFILSLTTIPEALTGNNIIRPHSHHSGPRMGLERAMGPFDHAILYGVFCASIVSLSIYTPTRMLSGDMSNKLKTSWVIVASFMSVSSGALAAVIVQLGLATWKKLTREVHSRWRIFGLLVLLAYFTIDLLSNRSPMRVILHRLTFNADTAYNRLIIWEWGTKYNVAEHPLFGIGFSEWVRPAWMHSTSMDNFWLVNMVRYGLPAFFFLASAILYLFIKSNRVKITDKAVNSMRTGWSFSMIGFIIAGCTVHFWNNLFVWLFFLLGSGAWFITSNKANDNQHSCPHPEQGISTKKV